MSIKKSKAWLILDKDEKLALTLSFEYDKSSWKAGEVMKKAHYKYLEIQKRAVAFMKLFKEHFDNHGLLVPAGSKCSLEFQDYLRLVIGKRLTVKEAAAETTYEVLKKTVTRNEFILSEMARLNRSKNQDDNDLHHLVTEFDRWNNHRILPGEIQEPSAYKRRNKHKSKKLIKLAYAMSPATVQGLVEVYSLKPDSRVSPSNRAYLGLTCSGSKSDIIIMPVHIDSITSLTQLNLFVFKLKTDAELFIELVSEYMSKEKKHCKDGQKFWPTFRKVSERAINYVEVNNINLLKKSIELQSRAIDMDIAKGNGLHFQ